MDLNRFTQKSRDALAAAQQEAAERHHQVVGAKHLLAALLRQKDGLTPKVIRQAGADPAQFEQELEKLLAKIPGVYGYEGTLQMSNVLVRVLSRAEQEAQLLKDEYISVEHLLLALLAEGEADLKELFRRAGLTKDALLGSLKNVRGAQRITSDNPEETYEALCATGAT